MRFRKTASFLRFEGIVLILLSVVVPQSLHARDFTALERTAEGGVYASSERDGFFYSRGEGESWRRRSNGLPKRIVWPFDAEEYRGITDIAVDPSDGDRVALCTSTGLYLSEDAGRQWREIPLRYPVKPSNYLTAVAFDSRKRERLYLGSSFNGLFVSEDGGRSWEKLGELLGPLYKGAGFYKEISDIAVIDGEAYLLNEFEGTLSRFSPKAGVKETIRLPDTEDRYHGLARYRGAGVSGPALEVHGVRERLIYQVGEKRWLRRPPLLLRDETAPEEKERGEYADKRAIYLNAYSAYGKRLEEHLEFMKRHGFNALVVDVKDDWGKLTYATELERHRAYGASRDLFDLRGLVARAHQEGIYVIGRVVVFKDKVLYHAEGNAYAVWDPDRRAPWGHLVGQENAETGESSLVQREFWVDPFSEEVWDYNIEIAEELQNFGIDEIQFDYIRFPSDGAVENIHYRYRLDGMVKTEAVESFFRKLRQTVQVPLSADLYGFNAWYRMGNWIGQDMEMLSHYVDVICPMFYPSHFPQEFLANSDYIERAHEIYLQGTRRAREISEGRSLIRPYVQAFLMGSELRMEQEQYERYLTRQIEGCYLGGAGGYTLWNNVNRYYMVNSRVSELNGKKEKEPETDT
jgi:hypothetical protein